MSAPTGLRPADPLAGADVAPDPPLEPARPPTSSAVVRAICALVGTVALGFGLVGLVLPVLPTTPFLLLTAACYARASTRLYGWLIGQPALGPILVEWRRSRSLPPGVKVRALVLVALSFGVSIVLVEALVLRLGLAATGMILMLFLSRIPTLEVDE